MTDEEWQTSEAGRGFAALHAGGEAALLEYVRMQQDAGRAAVHPVEEGRYTAILFGDGTAIWVDIPPDDGRGKREYQGVLWHETGGRVTLSPRGGAGKSELKRWTM